MVYLGGYKMRRLRIWISFLVAAFLLYLGLQQFTIGTVGLHGWFSVAWFLFCFLVIGGNLAVLAYERTRVYEGEAHPSRRINKRELERKAARLRA